MEWVTDERGNKCSVEYWGSREAAQKALDSCVYCRNCRNCRDCRDCVNCVNCRNCVDCRDCVNCRNCRDCVYCRNCTDSFVIGPFRSDGYQFIISEEGSVHAGCREFDSFTAARRHWTETRGGTALGDETIRILDFLEAEYKARKETNV